MIFSKQSTAYCDAVNQFLEKYICEVSGMESTLRESMLYSLTAGGKRVRPQLMLSFYHIFCDDWNAAVPFAAALEMIHTYSLIHDDLPCMDNDDYRRGKLTNHKKFGEYTAVLAGDALLNTAYEVMLENQNEAILPANQRKAMQIIAQCAGSRGMISGQMLDMQEKDDYTVQDLYQMQSLKTGALIRSACGCGVILSDHNEMLQKALLYADKIGLAFQIRDDLLDLEGDEKELGKAVHVDENLQKKTFPSFFGVSKSKEILHQLTEEAMEILNEFPNNNFLMEFTKKLELRTS